MISRLNTSTFRNIVMVYAFIVIVYGRRICDCVFRKLEYVYYIWAYVCMCVCMCVCVCVCVCVYGVHVWCVCVSECMRVVCMCGVCVLVDITNFFRQ